MEETPGEAGSRRTPENNHGWVGAPRLVHRKAPWLGAVLRGLRGHLAGPARCVPGGRAGRWLLRTTALGLSENPGEEISRAKQVPRQRPGQKPVCLHWFGYTEVKLGEIFFFTYY